MEVEMLGGFAVATGPSSQQRILAFAISRDAGLSTISHQETVRLSLTRAVVRVGGRTRQG